MVNPLGIVAKNFEGSSFSFSFVAKKNCAVKRRICVLLPLLLVAGCNLLESQYRLTDGDRKTKYPHEKIAGKADHPGDTANPQPAPLNDTVLWFSLVEFQEGYDWRRDSSYGYVSAEIILFRNFERVLSVPAEGNPSQDRHHIVRGELFTEYIDCGSTIFCRNGEAFLSMEGIWTLSGLLESGGHEYSLVRPMSSGGFVLYEDGIAVLRKDYGTVCGNFSDPAFASGGALYEDGGLCTFCYWTQDPKAGKVWHSVKNGLEELLVNVDAEAVRICSGSVCSSPRIQNGRIWSGVSIWDSGGPVTSGTLMDTGGSEICAAYHHGSGQLNLLSRSDGTVYVSESLDASVYRSSGSCVSIDYSDGTAETIEGRWRYIFPSCAVLAGNRLLLALSSEDYLGPSRIIWGERSWDIDINGFVTNVSYTVEEKEPCL